MADAVRLGLVRAMPASRHRRNGVLSPSAGESRVLAQVGSQGCRATFLGTANQKAQPFAHDQAKAERTVRLLLSSA